MTILVYFAARLQALFVGVCRWQQRTISSSVSRQFVQHGRHVS